MRKWTLLSTIALFACTVSSTNTETPAPTPAPDGGTTPPAVTCPTTTTGPTIHEGDVAADETWTAEASPHIVRGDVNVRDGKTLKIAPCAVVQIESNANLNVAFPLTPNEGTLIAEGTAEAPIRFEGKDGARWGHLYVRAPGSARLAWVTFENGGGGDSWGHETIGVTGDGDLPRKTVLYVDHVTVKGSRGAGIRLDTGAAFAPGSKDLVITGSGVATNNDFHPYPLEVGEGAIDTIPTGTYTGNKKDEIFLSPETVAAAGGFQQDTTMRDRGVPYHVSRPGDRIDLQVGSGSRDAVLTIEPGVKMLFEAGAHFNIESYAEGTSAIRAIGTAEKPIVFTSASATPKPGDWRGFYYNGPISPKNALEHVRIEYTGAECSCSLVTCTEGVTEYEAAIIFSQEPTTMFMKSSVIAHASGHGIVQGYDGLGYDWKATNTFEDVAGCPVTVPRNPNTACPDPAPACK